MKNVGKRMKVVGSYLFLGFLVFAVVGLLAFFQNSGNWLYLVAGLTVLASFFWLTVKVHFKHRGTMYGLENLR